MQNEEVRRTEPGEHAAAYGPGTFETAVARTLVFDLALLLRRFGETGATRCYAVVEMGQCEPGDAQALKQCLGQNGLEVGRQIERLFDGMPEEALADQGPWLVELPVSAPRALLQSLASKAGVQHALSIMGSTLALSDLARHLRSWSSGTIPADPEIAAGDAPVGAVLRWFDPRVGPHMVQAWSADARRQFLSAIGWWASWDASFSPRMLPGTAVQKTWERRHPLELDKALLRVLDGLNKPERMLAHMLAHDVSPGELDHLAPAYRRWQAHRLLSAALDQGLLDWSDQYMALALGLRIHPDVAQHASIQPLYAEAAANQRPLAASVTQVPLALRASLHSQASAAWQTHAQALLSSVRERESADVAHHPFFRLAQNARA